VVKYSIVIALFLTLLQARFLHAQDIHFSMFDMSPLTLNPANTGNMEGDRRFSNSYRNQWKAIGKPLQTFAAAYDQRLYFLPGNISGGLIFINDQSGGIDLVENKIMLTAATKFYKGVNSLSLGAQAGYCTKFIALNDVTFPEQYNRDKGQFDSRLANGETQFGLRQSYIDVNAGALFNHPMAKGNLQIGTSVFHLNRPDDSLLGNGDGLRARYSFNAQLIHHLNEKWYIRPSLLLMTLQKAQDFMVNALGGQNLPSNEMGIKRAWFGIALRTGLNRNGDAAIPMVGLEFNFVEVAMAYDINFSELQVATNNRGAFEFSLIYTSRNTSVENRIIPCDRF
jgi:type IX secretion system PorP/SprF family membrane protein